MKEKGMKEVYEIPRLEVRGIVLEAGIAAPVSIKGSITQDDWTDSPEESVSSTENIGFLF
jgi:hypothetical protein